MEVSILTDMELCEDCRKIKFKYISSYIKRCKKEDFIRDPPQIPLPPLRSMKTRIYCGNCQTIVRLAEKSWSGEFEAGKLGIGSPKFKVKSEYLHYRWNATFGPLTGKLSLGQGWDPVLSLYGGCNGRNGHDDYYGKYLLVDNSTSINFTRKLIAPFSKGKESKVESSVERTLNLGSNIQLIKFWLERCMSEHVGKCDTREPNTQEFEIILIDVQSNKLLNSKTTEKYYALSYVWGTQPFFRTEKSNIKELQSDGALDGPQVNIPVVIRDAMQLVRSLGDRYLWVDSLCIVQDDATHKHSQIAKMDIIYSQAFLTIAAMAGDDAYSSLMPSRPKPFPSLQIKGIKFIPKPSQHISTLFEQTKYESRSWTLQERLLGARCVFFTDRRLLFFCRNGRIYRDDDPEGFESGGAFDTKLASLHTLRTCSSWKDYQAWESYDEFLTGYTSRSLSYPSDILNAFSGMSSVISQKYNEQFVYGLPVSIFDWTLAWSPISPPFRRRLTDGHAKFPSWSWAGWVGAVNHPLLHMVTYGKQFTEFSSQVAEFYLQENGEIRALDRGNSPYKIPHVGRPREQPHKGLVNTSSPVLHFITKSLPASCFTYRTDDGTIETEQALFGSSPEYARNMLLFFGKEVGTMLSAEDNINQQLEDPNFEFVVISSYSQGAFRPNTMVALLVEQRGSCYERVALACIDEETWNSPRAKEKYIRLA